MAVLSGTLNCVLDANGCVTDGPQSYGHNERCTILVNVDGALTATSFDTERNYDKIGIGGSYYSGTSGPQSVAVRAGSSITWSSDYVGTRPGWVICFAPAMQSRPVTYLNYVCTIRDSDDALLSCAGSGTAL